MGDSRAMASFDPQEFGFDEPPPRPTTPPVRRGFLVVLVVLCIAALIVYGVPYVAKRIGLCLGGRAVAGGVGGPGEAGQAGDRRPVVRAVPDGGDGRLARRGQRAVAAVPPQSRGVPGRRGRRQPDDAVDPGAELGSGVIIDKRKGYVVTNNHVVKDADEILVRLGPGDDVPARLIGADPKSDLAVLQVKADLQVQAEWGDSDQLDNGDWVLAIGSPLGFDHSVTAGIVSATERNDVRITDYESFIQTDAAINPGNSGGPLIDLSGKVVGINTAIITQSGGYEGIGLAIPSALARRVVESLIKEGKVVRGYLGVRIHGLTADLARRLGLPNNRGALIADVQPGSPADRAGLKSGDVIVKLGDREVTDPPDTTKPHGEHGCRIESARDDLPQGRTPVAAGDARRVAPRPEVVAVFGFRIRPAPAGPEDAAALEIDQVVAGSPAFRAGLRPGMRILAVGQEPVGTPAQFEAVTSKLDLSRGLPLRIQLNDGREFLRIVGGPPANDQP